MIRLPGVGAMVLDAMFAGRWREARSIARELDSRVTIDRSPSGYLLTLWGGEDSITDEFLGATQVSLLAADELPQFVNVALERPGRVCWVDVVGVSGNVLSRTTVVSARGGRAGHVVAIDLESRLRGDAHEIQHYLGGLERMRRGEPAARVFGTPCTLCGCEWGRPCPLHARYL